ncbi:MAG: adenylate/guanylate cyclase domain-containing protein [Candidatus Limnocylindrales bacterium]
MDLGIVAPEVPDRFSPGDVRRVSMARSLEDAGIPLDGVAAAIRNGALSLSFLDGPAYERFASLAPETFQQVSDRTGIPLNLLMLIREAIGSAQPSPDNRMREDEMAVVPFIELQVAEGFRPIAIERLLRVQGECTRRIAEQEGAWWYSEVVAPAMAAGKGSEAIGDAELASRNAPLSEAAVLAMYHAQQAHVWTATLIEGFEVLMAKAGLHSRLERPPAICFLDISGYTRLTQERGDDAAADLAATLARLVQSSSVQHGGKPIKWLGDGVMFFFRDPGPGVRAALEMVDGLAVAGLPPAHVGLHAGPVLFQEGDYFGQTVNLTARIAEYARPGEVLVSQAVADASKEVGIAFADIGSVELKGVAGTTHVLRAHTA